MILDQRTIMVNEKFNHYDYQLCWDAYTGKGGFHDGSYLWSHTREDDYGERKHNVAYDNIFKAIVDAQVTPVFSEEPTRENDNRLFEAFIDDAENNKTKLNNTMRRLLTYKVATGAGFAIMDNFSKVPKTEKEAIDNRLFPYVYTKSMADVFKYETDKFGKLVNIYFWYDAEHVKEFNDSQIITHELLPGTSGETKVVNKVDHHWGKLPVIAIGELDILPMYSLATLARKMFNVDSEINELSRNQMFSILTYPLTGRDDDDDTIEIGSKNALPYDADSTHKPEFIAPKADVFKAQIEYKDELTQQMLRVAAEAGITNDTNVTSGKAESFRFRSAREKLKLNSTLCEDAEMEIKDMFSTAVKQSFNYEVDYHTNFSPTESEINDRIELLKNSLDIGLDDEAILKEIATLLNINN